MLVPGILVVLIFAYVPMFGSVVAFQDYTPLAGFEHSAWVGWENFQFIFGLPNIWQIIYNTVFISGMKIVASLVIPLVVAFLMNEVPKPWIQKSVQTAIYLPYFMSWVILGGIFIDILSPQGAVNEFLGLFGIKPIYFLGNNHWFPYVLVATDTWKNLGFNTLIYLAAMTSIDPTIYEAAIVDGAGRWRRAWHVTLPGIRPIIILVGTLSLGFILDAGFEQVFVMYSPQVYQSGDIIDTFVYRLGLVHAQFGPATAVGLFKSAVSFVLVSASYYVAYKAADYRIF